MSTEVKIIADTISPNGKRITTFVLTYPRYIHAEVLTHRVISKNCSSSRATPISKIIKQVICNPVVPIHFGANQKGMSAKRELTGWRYRAARSMWLAARWPAVTFAWAMNKIGLHKEIGNRVLEPWSHISVVLTATEFDNFYMLRCDKEHVHPDMYKLAEDMLCEHNRSVPKLSTHHLPFVTEDEKLRLPLDTLYKISVARCCRVSYLNHDNTSPNVEKDIKLYNELLSNHHMSPFEHQAESVSNIYGVFGNFVGWRQYRKTLENECCRRYLRFDLKK